jgi:hypothetical protein
VRVDATTVAEIADDENTTTSGSPGERLTTQQRNPGEQRDIARRSNIAATPRPEHRAAQRSIFRSELCS